MKFYLYIKTHNVTGLKYFGKTTKDPYKYHGSGHYWKRHLRKYGNDINTEIYGIYDDLSSLSEASIKFSIENNIVESNEWANLIIETGSGAPAGSDHPQYGMKHTKESLNKMSNHMNKVWADTESRESRIENMKLSWTDERRQEQTDRLKEEYWTDERKETHSKHMKQLHASRPDELGWRKSGFKNTPEHNKNISNGLKGHQKSESHKKNLSLAFKKRKKFLCPHCAREFLACHYSRAHGDKCKLNPLYHTVTKKDLICI